MYNGVTSFTCEDRTSGLTVADEN